MRGAEVIICVYVAHRTWNPCLNRLAYGYIGGLQSVKRIRKVACANGNPVGVGKKNRDFTLSDSDFPSLTPKQYPDPFRAHFLITAVRPTNSQLRSVYSSKMPFETTELSSNADFGELVRVEWESYEQPYCRLIRLFFPVLDNGPDARAKAMEESTERQLQWHNGDPTSHWIKVVDTKTGRIIGAACWHIYEENPYSTQSEEECTWYPAGEAREMANSLMGQFLTPRTKYMAKPHIRLFAPHGKQLSISPSWLTNCFI